MTKQPRNKSISQKIKQRREQLGLKPAELAKKMDVAKQEITRLETTSTRPSAEMLLKVAIALDAPMLYFLTDCQLNDVNEDILLTHFRKISDKDKKLVIGIAKLLNKESYEN